MQNFYDVFSKSSVLLFKLIFISFISFSQTVVTTSGTAEMCVGGNTVTLGDITIAETVNTDFQNTTGIETYVISAPSANFEFNTAASVTLSHSGAGTVSNISVNITANAIELSYELANTANGIDVFTISGIEVLGINAVDAGNIVRSGGTATQNGNEVADGQIHATLSSNNGATANAGTYAAICSGSTLNLSGLSGGMVSDISWSAPSGSFSDAMDLNAVYTPSVSSGSVTLTLSVDSDGTGGCAPATSDAVININQTPEAPEVTFNAIYQVGEAISAAPQVISDNTNLQWHSDLSLSNDITVTSGNAAIPALSDLGFSSATANNTTVYVTNTIAGCRSEPTPVNLVVSDGVTVNEATNATKLCVGGNAINIGDIVITETDAYAFGNTQSQVSIEISSPSPKFEFFTGGGVSITQTQIGGTFSNLSATVTVNKITLAYKLANTENGIDELTISGVRVMAKGNAGVGEILRTGGNAQIAGLEISDAVNFATLKSYNSIDVSAGANVDVCVGETVLLQGSIGGSASSATWSGPGTFADNTALSTLYTPSSSTAGTVETLTLTTNDPDGAGGCNAGSSTVDITIRGIPAAPTVNFTQNTCVGDALSNPIVTAGTSNLEWHSSLSLENDIVVTSGNAASPNLADLGFSTAAEGSFSVYVTQTSAYGCQSTPRKVELNVFKVPTAPIITTPKVDVCQNDNTPIALTAIGTNLKWYRNDNTFITQSNTFDPVTLSEVNTALAGTTTFKVSQTNNNCESAFSTIDVEVQALPNTSVINGSNTVCAGTQGSIYSVANTAGHSYTWTLSGGGTISSGQGTSSIAINWNDNTSTIENYTLSVVEEDETGCADNPVDLNIIVNPVPLVSFTGLSSSYSSSDVSAYELTGTPAGGTFFGRGISFNAGTGNYEFVPSEAGTGSIPVGYQYVTTEGCTVYASPFITNVGAPSASGISGLNATKEYCVNDADVSISGSSAAAGSTFFFSVFPQYGELENDPAFPGNNDRAIFSPSKVGAGTYYLFYNDGTSWGSAEIVTVYDVPEAPTTQTALTYCQGDNIAPLTASGTGTIKWYTNPPAPGTHITTATPGEATAAELSLTNATDSPTPIGSPIKIWVTQTDGNGCESEPAVVEITVVDKPNVPVLSSAVPNYCPGDILQDIVVSGENGANWEWSELSDFSSSVGTPTTNGVTSTLSNPILLSSNGAASKTITYYVRQQVNGCYSDPLQVDITVYPEPPSPSLLSAIPEYCPGDILQDIQVSGSVGGVFEWSDAADFSNSIGNVSNSGNTSTLNYPIEVSANGDAQKIYKIYVRQQINGCYSPATELNVLVNPTPDAPIISSAQLSYCHGEILQDMTATGENGATWQWSNSADFSTTVGSSTSSGNTSTFQNPIVLSAFGPGPTTINYWVRQQVNGCYGPATQISISVFPIPNAPVLSGAAPEYCSGSTIAPISVTGEAGAAFKWYNNASLAEENLIGSSATLANPPISNINETDNPIVQSLWVVKQLNGCTSPPLQVDFTIHPFPAVPNANYTAEYCSGEAIQNIKITGRVGATFTWYSRYDSVINLLSPQPAITTDATANELSIDTNTPGSYNYFVTQTLNSCESAPQPIEVTVHEIPPAPIANSPEPVCIFQDIQDLQAEGETGATFKWYSDAALNNLIGTGASINPGLSNTSASETDFWVTQTLNNCEGPTTQITVTIYDIPPQPVVDHPAAYCVGEQIQNITATGSNLRWYSDAALTNQVGAGNSFAPGIDNSISSVSKFYVTQTFFSGSDFSGCTSSPVEVEVTIHDLPVVSIADLDQDYCVDEGIATIRGIPNGGTFTGAGISGSNFNPEEAGVGSHLIKYYFQNLNGCLDSASQLVTVNPLPGVTFSKLDASYCINYEMLPLNGFPEGGTFLLNGNPMSDVFRPDVIGVGNHEIIYRYIDNNTCVNADTQYVTIYPAPITNFRIDEFCIGSPTNFFDSSSVSSGNIVAWQWDFNDGNESTLQNPTNTFTEIGFHTIGLDIYTENNCSDYTEKDIYIGAIPEVNFEWSNTCVNDQVNFSNLSDVEGEDLVDWLWEFGDGQVSNEFSPQHKYNSTGVYQVKLTVFSETNCAATIVKDVAIFPSIDAYPYREDFEGTESGWFATGENSSWEIGVPSGNIITPNENGTTSWVTNASGFYNNEEHSYVESPCFDLSFLDRPKVSFDLFFHTQKSFDGAVLQSSINDGQSWELVGSIDDPVNWFNTVSINGNPGGQTLYGWSGTDTLGWMRVSHAIDHLKGEASVRFRIAFGSDASFNEREGVAFDNFRIEERNKLVLLETFTNSSNDNDALVNPVSREQINDYSADIIPINYHTNFPGVDPINRMNPADPSARALYYGVMNTPRTVIDGTVYEKTDASPFWDVNNLLMRALTDNKINIEVNFGEANQETLDINVNATAIEDLQQETVIQIVCVERDITEFTGENGENFFDWVVRKMLPDAAGSSFKNVATGEKMNVSTSWKPKNIFDPNNMVVVVFAQNNITKEIYNAVVKTPDYFPDIISSSMENIFDGKQLPVIYPNPVKDILQISLEKNISQDMDVQVINTEGKELQSKTITKGSKHLNIDVYNLPRGTYFVKYTLNGEFVLAQKFVKL